MLISSSRNGPLRGPQGPSLALFSVIIFKLIKPRGHPVRSHWLLRPTCLDLASCVHVVSEVGCVLGPGNVCPSGMKASQL